MSDIIKIKELRSKTGSGVQECKNALIASKGDVEEAIVYLRKLGKQLVISNNARKTAEGMIGHYIHAGSKIGVILQVDCETDFCARGNNFREFVKDVAMHIAATNPQWVRREDVPINVIVEETEIVSAGLDGKPDNIAEKIISGRLNKFYKDTCLMEQAWVKDPNITITDLLGNVVSQIKENIVVKRFARFVAGE